MAYNWDDESEDYDSSEDEAKENHIFLSLRTLKTWLDAWKPPSDPKTQRRAQETLPGLFYARHRTQHRAGAEPDSHYIRRARYSRTGDEDTWLCSANPGHQDHKFRQEGVSIHQEWMSDLTLSLTKS